MMFRNYCIIVLGNVENVEPEIEKISESKINYLRAGGMIIATFVSLVDTGELTEWFRGLNRNFLLFDLNPEHSGFNFIKGNIQEVLFGFLRDSDPDELNAKFNSIVDLPLNTPPPPKKRIKLDEEIIQKMTQREREEFLDELIEYGLEKLSESDKKLLPLLTK